MEQPENFFFTLPHPASAPGSLKMSAQNTIFASAMETKNVPNITPGALRSLHFMLHNGKNPKWKYYIAAYWQAIRPRWAARSVDALLREAQSRPDYPDMEFRRDYCCRLLPDTPLGHDAPSIAEIEITGQKVYPLDTLRLAARFPSSLRLRLLPGDITYTPPFPSVTKSRPIGPSNANSVLLPLDRVRHFIFVPHDIPTSHKLPIALFRGKVGGKEQRHRLMTQFCGHPLVDAGDVGRHPAQPHWKAPKLTIAEQLRYRFILAVEGNDVASNLKWVMSSNSVAVMPRPTVESWFMEGTLRPGYHYIEVKPDFSDLPEKIEYYAARPAEVEAIVRHAHEHVARFLDARRELLTGIMVLDKYFRATGQR